MKPPFRAYDIRGKYPNEINDNLAYSYTYSFVELIKPKRVVVGRDHRLSSDIIHKEVIRALIDSGCQITDIGFCTTPMLYFASGYYKFDGAVMITASHLPKEYNGLKFCKKNAEALSYGTGLDIIEFLSNKRLYYKNLNKKGKLKKKNITKDYERFILKNVKKTDYKIIIDTCHMMGYLDFKILNKICNARGLFLKVNPNFPDHGVDPTVENNLRDIKKEVIKNKADLGIAFDGDCDRVIFIDNDGKKIKSDVITTIFAEFLTKPKDKVIFDMRSSLALENFLKGKDIKTIRSKVGHSIVAYNMKKNKAVVGGEKTGHYYFKNFYYADNALLATINLINILKETKLTSGQLANKYNLSFTSGELNFKVINKNKTLKLLEKHFSKSSIKIIHFDGLSIYHKDFLIHARYSNTQEIMRIDIEAISQELIENIKQKINKLLN